MILKSLTLHNFMSYADVQVDLSSVAVACLSGRNGAGKSALIDAITWALWEESRSTSDELIRIGEKEMWVDLVFEYESRTYRVRRSRLKRAAKGGQKSISKGSLDLQLLAALPDKQTSSEERMARAAAGQAIRSHAAESGRTAIASHPALRESDGEDHFGYWRSLTGSTIRGTQQAICELLRMNYETFINSAYLRQGRADEFTTRSPSERKQVLSEILGLAYFDRLQEACRLRARDGKLRMEMIENSLLVLPDLERDLEETENRFFNQRRELDGVVLDLAVLDKSVSELAEHVQELKLMQQKIDQSAVQLQDLYSDIGQLSSRKEEMEKRRRELANLIDRSLEIKHCSVQFESAKSELEKLDRKSQKAQSLSEEKLRLQSQLANLRSRLEVELDHTKMATEAYQKRAEKLRIDTRDGDKTLAAYDEFKKLIGEEAEQAQKQDTFTRLMERSSQLQSWITEARIKLEAELGQKELSLAEIDEVVSTESILSKQKEELEEEVKHLECVESEFDLVEEKGLLIKGELETLDAKFEEMKRRQEEIREKIRELKEHQHESICPLCAAPIVDRASVLSHYDKDIEGLENERTKISHSKNELEEERNQLRIRYLKLKRDLGTRKALDTRIGQFNERIEAIERAKSVRCKLVNDILGLELRLDEKDYAQIERESLINVKTEIYKLEFDPIIYSSLQSQIRAKRHLESRYIQLKKDLSELEKVEQELPKSIEKENLALEELASESYGHEIRAEIKVLKEELEDLDYDRDKHQELKRQILELLPFIEQMRDLRKAMEELPSLDVSLDQLSLMLSGKSGKIPDLEREIEEMQAAVGDLSDKEHHLLEEQKQLADLRDRCNALSKDAAVSENRRQQLIKDLDGFHEKKKMLEQLTQEREDHLFLAESFGKKGIQAVIIENAVPEIEREANRILARLSDNQMHVALVTQQKTKSGAIHETLDIVIGDEIGTRNYELFSGGEKFKVNFAIRIALSRLLARRAGARLETLIIDEGFGSQDDQSRDRLVRSIQAIQPDFQKILVITHIADVREMFPVQIVVQKESGVSRLQVIS